MEFVSDKTSGISPIMKLPVEVLEAILSHTSTRNLILCRQVCQTWKILASSICRRRYVAIKLNEMKDENEIQELKGAFNLGNLPWSACELPEFPNHRIGPFLKIFGVHILKLILTEVYSGALISEFLGNTPNLRHLELKFPEKGLTIDNSEEGRIILDSGGNSLSATGLRISLPDLTFLKMDVSDDTIELLELLLNASSQLKKLEVSLSIKKVENIKKTFNLLANLQTVLIDIIYNPAWVEALKHIAASDQEYFGPAETLLADTNWMFDNFEIEITRDSNNCPTIFKFPANLSAKYLHIGIQLEHDNDDSLSPNFFRGIQSHHFPHLEKVVIQLDNVEFFETNLFSEGTQFDTVNELKLSYGFDGNYYYPALTDRWNHVFPNLRQLDIEVYSFENKELFLDIFRLVKLEHLVLRIWTDQCDMNSVLSGIDYPESVYKQQKEVVDAKRKSDSRPSLLSLTELKTLEMRGNLALSDAGIALSFMQMKPLNRLLLEYDADPFLGNVISEEYLLQLGTHHYCVIHNNSRL